ncbi:MAG: hypothetical protein COA45_06190 [Zetaproteobacteria bacterium]|nr:MAG: hypothetical protein COA45_06190 [Zetaproteobacteria bacterium]
MSEETEILKQTIIEEEKPKASLANKLKEQKKAKGKKKRKRIIIWSFILLFGYAFWWLSKPFKATAEYGICKSFLELYVPYPHTIYVSEIKPQRDGSLKLWFTHTGAFGEYRMESFTCRLVPNPETGLIELTQLKLHKVQIGPDRVKHLNSAMPYFVENPLVLNWPTQLPDSLNDLHFDFDKVRRIIINPNK